MNVDENLSLDVNIPKKRGRKPKKINLEAVLSGKKNKIEEEPPEKKPKKRGRKPKAPSEKEVKIPKKRGRKPILSQVVASNKNLSENFITKDNVLHLKINSQEAESNIMMDSLYQYNPEINDPEPYDPIDNYAKTLENLESSLINKYDTHNYSLDKNNNILDRTEDKSEDGMVLSVDEEVKNETSSINYQDLVSTEDKIIQSVESNINNIPKKNLGKKVNSVMVFYNEYNKRKEWPKKSAINCFWCCHTFNCIPCALPTKLKGETFHVYGNFCSKECAAAYNFESQDAHNSQNKWERYSLLNHMYSIIEDNPDLKVNLAPHRMCLEMFGGSLSIEEFRESLSSTKNYNIVFPPMVSIIPAIEANNKVDNSKRNESYYIPIDKERIKRVNNDLRLKRRNPVNNKNTLENCMRLKYT
jgi:hypothetical protein